MGRRRGTIYGAPIFVVNNRMIERFFRLQRKQTIHELMQHLLKIFQIVKSPSKEALEIVRTENYRTSESPTHIA